LINNNYYVLLSEYCFTACGILNTAAHGRNADGPSESVRAALADLERCVDQSRSTYPSPTSFRVMEEIERSLRRRAVMPHIIHNKSKIEGQKLRIREILNTLDASSAPLDETLPLGSHDTVTTPTSDIGALPALP